MDESLLWQTLLEYEDARENKLWKNQKILLFFLSNWKVEGIDLMKELADYSLDELLELSRELNNIVVEDDSIGELIPNRSTMFKDEIIFNCIAEESIWNLTRRNHKDFL